MFAALLSPVLDKVFGVIDKAVTDKDLAAKLRADMTMAVLNDGAKTLEAQKEIILAEAGGTGLKSQWRPLLMLTIVAIVANNFLVAPYVNAIFGAGTAPTLDLPQQLWDLMNVGVGGYLVGRSAEKIAGQVGTVLKK